MIFSFLDGTLRRSARMEGHDDLQRANYDGTSTTANIDDTF